MDRIPEPKVVVSDGGTGFAKALKKTWPHARHQRCLFHVFCQVKRYTTSQPKTLAGIELYALAKDLLHVESLVEAQRLNPAYPRLSTGEGDGCGVRVVSGNVLSGTQIAPDGFVGAYDSLLTLMPEGNYYDFMGWLMPGLRKHSFSRTFLSGFVPQCM